MAIYIEKNGEMVPVKSRIGKDYPSIKQLLEDKKVSSFVEIKSYPSTMSYKKVWDKEHPGKKAEGGFKKAVHKSIVEETAGEYSKDKYWLHREKKWNIKPRGRVTRW